MKRQRQKPNARTGNTPMKVMVTATTFAATLSGWAIFAAGSTPQHTQAYTAPVEQSAAVYENWQAEPAINVVNPASPSTTQLRQVSAPQPAPPAPVTTTQSSR